MPFIEFSGISKRFPGVVALDGVSFGVERGTCHALIGENGAGKSTLGKILAGVYTADSGQLSLDGQIIEPRSPSRALSLGIAMVHQELAFCPNLSVAENLCLGDLSQSALGWVDRRQIRSRAQQMLHEIGARIDPEALVGSLSTAQEQLVQIAAATGTNAKVIVMDEPTSSLSAGETKNLFRLVQDLKGRGITVIYVSHRIEELFALCDNITVLRDGRHISTEKIPATNPSQVISQMIGRELLVETPAHLARQLGPELLDVRELASPGHFADINFHLHAGEVVGLAGLVGAGRSEVARAIFGLDANTTGRIEVRGRLLKLASIQSSLRSGIGLVPEDRKRQGLILPLNCRENTSIAALPFLSRLGWIKRKAERALVERYVKRLKVKAPSTEIGIAVLSGGNQQKIALAKWLARDCDVLIVDEPTRGIDVGAKSEIYRLLDELACQGKALFVISSELPELIGLCRRILVMRGGCIAGEIDHASFTEDKLLRLMAGVGEGPDHENSSENAR